MAVQISITPSVASIAQLRALYGDEKRGVAARAIQAAVSRTVVTGVALIARRIGEEVNLPIADIKASIYSRRGSFDDPVGVISVERSKTVWLSQFLTAGQRSTVAKKFASNIKQKLTPRGGVRVRVRKKLGVELVPRAFLAVTPHSGHIGIFERVGEKRAMKSGRYAGKIREVIRRRRGPTPFSVFLNAAGEGVSGTMVEEVHVKLKEAMQKNIRSQIARALAGRI